MHKPAELLAAAFYRDYAFLLALQNELVGMAQQLSFDAKILAKKLVFGSLRVALDVKVWTEPYKLDCERRMKPRAVRATPNNVRVEPASGTRCRHHEDVGGAWDVLYSGCRDRFATLGPRRVKCEQRPLIELK
jgi:hypothetical protein